jgi:YcxB-like protein
MVIFKAAMSGSAPFSLKITFQLGLRDVYKSNVSITTDSLRKFLIPFWGIIFLLFASAGFALTAKAVGFAVPFAMGSLWGVLFLPAFLLSMCYVTPYFAAKSLYKNSVNLHNAIHYSFSDDLVTQEMASGRAELLWSAFIRVRETPHLFLFYVQKHLAHPVPKRAFASEQEIAGFRELIRRHVREVSLRG